MNAHNEDLQKALLAKRTIMLQGDITTKWEEHLLSSLEYLNFIDSSAEIILKLDSGGGSVPNGNVMCENIIHSPSTVRGIVTGFACSMTFTILQSCHIRSAYGNSDLMFHPYRLNELSIWRDDFDEYIQKVRNSFHYFLEHLSTRSGQPFDVLAKWAKQERHFTGYEAKELGFVDELLL
jgi:ATP-dependent protease ClpP protease subunit